jgi:ATP-dependent RNA helicase RhlE
MNSFEGLNLSSPILQALKSKGYTQPTPVQEKSIPMILDGKDLFVSAQTGTGKTAAFALPLLQLLQLKKTNHPQPRILVLAPTRELAVQIGDSFRDYGKHLGTRQVVIYGGVSQGQQTRALKRGVDIIVATPGRLMDLMEQGFVKLNQVEYFILDEADRMLDMGFIHDIKRIAAKVPAQRQTLLFSATLPAAIKKLAHELLRHPETVQILPEKKEQPLVKQQVFLVEKNEKTELLSQLIAAQGIDHALVFTRTRRGADKLVKSLGQKGIRAAAIHGDKSQNQRQRVLEDFKSRKLRLLIATDVASRGIDVKHLSHVINYDLPDQADTYTHRIGRTGRAGAEGIALSFCSREEQGLLKDIQRFLKEKLLITRHQSASATPTGTPAAEPVNHRRAEPAKHFTAPKQDRGFTKNKTGEFNPRESNQLPRSRQKKSRHSFGRKNKFRHKERAGA